MKVTRRVFLKTSGLALASVGVAPVLGPQWLRSAAFAAEPGKAKGKILICIFQRGAVDGLSMVVPHGDPYYYQHRPLGPAGIALARTGEQGVLDLDGTFGLNPALKALKPIYDAGHFAPIQAVGSPSASRSHFDAQDYMELATPGSKSADQGWLARVLAACPEDTANGKNQGSIIRAVSLTNQTPLSLKGADDTLAFPNLSSFSIRDGSMGGGGRKGGMVGAMPNTMGGDGFEGLYENAVGDVLHDTTRDPMNGNGDAVRSAGKEGFAALKMLESIRAERYMAANGATYPRSQLGSSLQQIAQLIKANVGLQIAFAECTGWDTHAGQGGAQGQLARRLGDFGDSIGALYRDLGDRMSDVVILTMSEFGRTARQNGSGGTDHGHGTCFLALGGNIQGGKVLGKWPGLAPENLNDNRDLAVTTDFRDVFGEIAARHLGDRKLTATFPDYTATPNNFRGLLRV